MRFVLMFILILSASATHAETTVQQDDKKIYIKTSLIDLNSTDKNMFISLTAEMLVNKLKEASKNGATYTLSSEELSSIQSLFSTAPAIQKEFNKKPAGLVLVIGASVTAKGILDPFGLAGSGSIVLIIVPVLETTISKSDFSISKNELLFSFSFLLVPSAGFTATVGEQPEAFTRYVGAGLIFGDLNDASEVKGFIKSVNFASPILNQTIKLEVAEIQNNKGKTFDFAFAAHQSGSGTCATFTAGWALDGHDIEEFITTNFGYRPDYLSHKLTGITPTTEIALPIQKTKGNKKIQDHLWINPTTNEVKDDAGTIIHLPKT